MPYLNVTEDEKRAIIAALELYEEEAGCRLCRDLIERFSDER